MSAGAPALYDHCVDVWHAMYEEAKPSDYDGVAAIMIYEGYLTKLFTKLRLSVPYYTTVMAQLKAMDCVRQLRRGGGGTPSQWALVQEPTAELFETTRTHLPSAKQKRDDVILQMLSDFNRRLQAVEAQLAG